MKIVGISGRKQSGKNTASNVFHAIVMKEHELIQDWTVDEQGKLHVLTRNVTGTLGWGELDVTRKDSVFAEYADANMWPYVKSYSFADSLKWMCTELFEIPHRCVWGTDDHKNQRQEHLLWENMPGVTTEKTPQDPVIEEVAGRLGKYYEKVLSGVVYHEPGPMTSREFMQYLGTDIMRKMFGPIWIRATMKKIKKEQSELAIIVDVRFPNEGEAIEDEGGILLRCTRNLYPEDSHRSEIAMDDYPFLHTLDNKGMEISRFLTESANFYNKHLHRSSL
jgi:hypothetical protein